MKNQTIWTPKKKEKLALILANDISAHYNLWIAISEVNLAIKDEDEDTEDEPETETDTDPEPEK